MSTMPLAISGDHSKQPINQTNASPEDPITVFSREVISLLKTKPYCVVPISRFVPAYHYHYGRQCLVSQFGFSKLIDLLEAIPQVVQIVGDGSASHRCVTLTFEEQVKRFASDLIRVVKSRPGKRLKLSQLAATYQQMYGRTFRIEDYGTTNINILLAEIWPFTLKITPIQQEPSSFSRNSSDGEESSSGVSIASSNICMKEARTTNNFNHIPFVDVPLPDNNLVSGLILSRNKPVERPHITNQYPDCWFEIPRPERSRCQIELTEQFGRNCVELLSKQENFTVPFSRFIPAYYWHFNQQCKVSVFGFSKLIDLLDSLSPEVVDIIDQGPGEEKLIKLAKAHWPQRLVGHEFIETEPKDPERNQDDKHKIHVKRSPRMAANFQSFAQS